MEGGKPDKIKSYTNQRLVNKLRKHFDNTVLNIMSDTTKKLNAWKKEDMSFNVSNCSVKEKRQKVERSSMGLRSNTDERNLTIWE